MFLGLLSTSSHNCWMKPANKPLSVLLVLSPFSCVEGPASLTNITPWTITTRNFINNICLRFQRWSKFWGRELLLKGDEWFVHHCDVVFFEDTSQRFCYAFNVWKRGERLAWFGRLDHLEKCSNKFLRGQHCWASGFVGLDVFNEIRWITIRFKCWINSVKFSFFSFGGVG